MRRLFTRAQRDASGFPISTWLAVICVALVLRALPSAQEPLAVSMVARSVQPGEVVKVDVTCACSSSPRATAFGLMVPLTQSSARGHWQGLVGIDVDTKPGTYPLLVEASTPAGAITRPTMLDVRAARFKTRTLRVAPEFVEPPPDQVERILAEQALLEATFKTITPRAWKAPFALPLTTQPTANFGSRSVFNGEPRNPHAGVDFRAGTGTVVRAPAAGRVALVKDLFFTGNTVVIDHGDGLYTLFAHLSATNVKAGDAVVPGARLGRVGATGRVTGPHLHWSVRLNGARVDPLSLVWASRPRA